VVTLGFVAIVACNGIDDVALVFLATDTLGGGDGAVGLLLAAVGIGLLAGYALLARTRRRVAMPALLLAGFAVSSAGNLLTGLAWAVAAAFALQAVRGLGIAALDVAATTLVQRIVPAGLLGRVFGTRYGGIGSRPRSPTCSATCSWTVPAPGPRSSPPARPVSWRRRPPPWPCAGLAGGALADSERAAQRGLRLWNSARRRASQPSDPGLSGTPASAPLGIGSPARKARNSVVEARSASPLASGGGWDRPSSGSMAPPQGRVAAEAYVPDPAEAIPAGQRQPPA
jgi:hypothetical protein